MPATRRPPEIKGVPRSRWIKAHGKHDQQGEWYKPKTCPPWLAQETFQTLPPALLVRDIRDQVSVPGFRPQPITVVTTFVDSEHYLCADVAALYRQRWETDTHLGQRKTPMKMDVLHSKTVLGALKELTVFAMVYNLVRLVILPSAQRQQVEVARISFLDALRW
jgi:hypothetical protein